jgi:hypothetical protein
MNDPVLVVVGGLLAEIAGDLDEPAAMVNNAVIVADFIDADGEHWLRIIRNQDSRAWMIRGMLHEVLADMDAHEVVYQLGGEE